MPFVARAQQNPDALDGGSAQDYDPRAEFRSIHCLSVDATDARDTVSLRRPHDARHDSIRPQIDPARPKRVRQNTILHAPLGPPNSRTLRRFPNTAAMYDSAIAPS